MAQAAAKLKMDEMDQSIEDIHNELTVFNDSYKQLASSGEQMSKKIDESFSRMEAWEKRFDLLEKHMFLESFRVFGSYGSLTLYSFCYAFVRFIRCDQKIAERVLDLRRFS
ncbi:hypothetical protein Rs2_14106 [Raphanus sativus]|nr:hypothetical protein Rs2_14106 [Raphanus sativus]